MCRGLLQVTWPILPKLHKLLKRNLLDDVRLLRECSHTVERCVCRTQTEAGMILADLIREAWSNACHNGDEAQLRSMDYYSLACDMYDCDAQIGRHPFKEVKRAVEEFVNNQYQ